MHRVVVMGVAGSGKSTIGRRLADGLGVDFIDGDDLHPEHNVGKMAAGQPLTDDERWPWLDLLADELSAREGVVIACSALKRSYRDRLRSAGDVRIVFLDVEREEAERRLSSRSGHFMKSTMLESQFATLEPPAADEVDVVSLAADLPVEELSAAAEEALTAI
jgi:gluconokinase